MFGYVKPVPDELLVKEHNFYRATYCGICRAMQKHTGRLCALSLTYDSVFFAIVRMMLTGEKCTASRCRCLAHPVRCRDCVRENDALIFTARAFSILAYGKACDACDDTRGLHRLPLLVARGVLRRAAKRADLPDLLAVMQRELAALAELERAHCPSIDEVVDCSGRMLGEFFAAELVGDEREIAYGIGYRLGRFIAAADAAEDFEKDRKNHNYNPYLFGGTGDFDEPERAAARLSLRAELYELEKEVLRLPHKAYPYMGNIVKNILYYGLPAHVRFLDEREGQEKGVKA
ncbi:MAG: hypothetical protein IJ009_04455 [Clostridia bacterium]|nr:hypothetical protein [Clostridia bacterium]